LLRMFLLGFDTGHNGRNSYFGRLCDCDRQLASR
jgi:hypothetical protein